jgi:hypothetical protein
LIPSQAAFSTTLISFSFIVSQYKDMRIGGTRRDKPAVFIGRAPLLRRISSSRSKPRLVEKDSAENAQKAA